MACNVDLWFDGILCRLLPEAEELHMNTAKSPPIDMALEVVVIPVSDVDRAASFYGSLGWRLDADIANGMDFRLVQFTPPGSGCSIQFGRGVTPAAPGSEGGLYLVVSDIQAARKALADCGVAASEVFHRSATREKLVGADPQRRSYGSFVSFCDPDGNAWLVQEVTARLPGRSNTELTTFNSATALADTLRRAEAAHGEHEKRIGQKDANWADWYAQYIVSEQAEVPLPL
jgi:catechol 2,3-dioxygenase-like lactoylglutathione lyase family enzyme